MKLHFDAKQAHQEKAVEALIELFGGLPPAPQDAAVVTADSSLIGVVANNLQMAPDILLENLRAVQERAGIPQSDALYGLDLPVEPAEAVEVPVEDGEAALGDTHKLPNFSVEMETGTGKTYVYIRTALELSRAYGLKKFIIVVPSVAIREGVFKTLEITHEHFLALYDNEPYSFYAYDGRKPNLIRNFSNSDRIELMVMTLDSFNKEGNVIRRPSDQLQGDTPLELIRATRPVLLLDEPQNMESVNSRRSLGDLDPLCILRFSATLKNAYNLVHQLTPYDAYTLGLVKQIEVAGIEPSLDANRPFIELVEVKIGQGRPKAKVKVHKLDKNGRPKVSSVTLGRNDDLSTKTGRSEYDGYRVSQISAAVNPAFVEFSNAVKVRQGEALGADKTPLFDAQIRQTIEVHLERQQRFLDRVDADPELSRDNNGVKVLSLFFIDKVSNYRTENGNDGLLAGLFDKAFIELRDKTDVDDKLLYPWAKDLEPEQVRGAYFAVKKVAKDVDPTPAGVSEGDVLKETQRSASSKEDAAAFSLIMREKERLLSLDEPVAFIFSHSALREGWDNPNVFQICTLNASVDSDRKRQELGRGLRLCVNQAGVRVPSEEDSDVNVLTVVVNENYESYVRKYQEEVEEEFGDRKYGQEPKDRAKAHKVKLRADKLDSTEFRALWDRIKVRTRYSVSIDTDKLIAEVVAGLNASTEPPKAPGISMVVARVSVQQDGGDATDYTDDKEPTFVVGEVITDTETKVEVAERPTAMLPNLPQLIANLLARQDQPVRITRRTILRIVQAAPYREVAFANPQGWAAWVAREIVFQLTRQVIDTDGGITYTRRPPEDWYHQQRFQDIETYLPQSGETRTIVDGNGASLYDEVICDSGVEKEFVEHDLGKDGRVKLYVKLPGWFKIETPVGQYNPDWALVCDERDNVGNLVETVYLVRETKSTKDLNALRPSERDKIICAAKHFAVAAPDLDYAHTVAGEGLKLPSQA